MKLSEVRGLSDDQLDYIAYEAEDGEFPPAIVEEAEEEISRRDYDNSDPAYDSYGYDS